MQSIPRENARAPSLANLRLIACVTLLVPAKLAVLHMRPALATSPCATFSNADFHVWADCCSGQPSRFFEARESSAPAKAGKRARCGASWTRTEHV
eukprot:6201437-Pleurochrysis_carterae.AAC.2